MKRTSRIFITLVVIAEVLLFLLLVKTLSAQWDPIPFPAGASWDVYVACADYEMVPPIVQVRSRLSGVEVAEVWITEIEIIGNGLVISQPTTMISEGDHVLFEMFLDVDSSYTFEVMLGATEETKRLTIVAGAAPQCGAQEHVPDMPEIEIDNGDLPAPDGCYMVEIDNQDGGWSLVADANNPNGIVLHAVDGKVELIGSHGQDTDPNHYRLVPIDCQ